MRVIIAGSRTITDYDVIQQAVDLARTRKGIVITEVASGMARGVDSLAWEWAEDQGLPRVPFHAQWRDADFNYDHCAGDKRNERMAQWAADGDVPGALIAIMHADEPTTGTSDMIARGDVHGLLTYVHLV